MQKYSFLICVYKKDNPEYLKLSIDSMLTQTARPDEIVLVKDGPLPDELDGVIAQYDADNPGLFTIVQNPENIGLGKSLNVAIEHSRNELMARMDADDICESERCEKQLKAFEEDPELDICGTSTGAFTSDPANLEWIYHAAETSEAIYERGKSKAAFSHVSVMYKKSTLMKYGCYGNYRRAQDTDLFCRMIYGGCKTRNLPEVLVRVRKDEDMTQRSASKESIRCVLAIRKNLWKIGYMSFGQYFKLWCAYKIRALIPKSLASKVYYAHKKSKVRKSK